MDDDSELDIVSDAESEVRVDTTDIDAQIAALVEQKQRAIDDAERKKRRQDKEKERILVGATPTKKEKVKREDVLPIPPKAPAFVTSRPKAPLSKSSQPVQKLPSLPPSSTAGPSKMAANLASFRNPNAVAGPSKQTSQWAGRSRSIPTVAKKEAVSDDDDELEVEAPMIERDDVSLALIEKLSLGPKEFGYDPEGEKSWEYVEPNSGIRLSKRTLSHSDLQEHMYGRYFLPPSLLYSIIRLSRDGATYDVPVDNDWITIAVVAERGEVRVSGGGGNRNGGQAEDESSDEDKKPDLQKGDFSLASPSKKAYQRKKGKDDNKEAFKRRGPKKYINLRLAALPSRSKGGSGGDALLQLLLFQAESIIRSEEVDEEGNRRISYRGGSGGAYEKWGNLNVGDVVGIVSPRILRPMKAGGNKPHPLTLPLALNPNSCDSIFVIGKAKDLGRCTANQRDGNRCRSWVDMRVNKVCDYHVHLALQRSRGSRAEFTASTSAYGTTDKKPSMSTSSAHRPGQPPRKGIGINHTTKTGLLPASGPQVAPRGDNGGGGATYVVGAGRTIQTGNDSDRGLKNFGDENVGEIMGRSKSAKRKRAMEHKETEKVLSKLMEGGQGSSGAKNVAAVRAKMKEYDKNKALEKIKSKDKGKERIDPDAERAKRKRQREKDENKEEDDTDGEEKKRPFSAESIKKIGYDPTAASRAVSLGKNEKKLRDDTIASLKNPEGGKGFHPKQKIQAINVKAPDGYVPGTDKRNTSRIFVAKRKDDAESEGGDTEDDGDMIDLD